MPLPLRQFTAVAGRAADFAMLFNAKFAGGLHGSMSYVIDLTGPIGPSTAGGKQALQHIRLVAADGSPAIVIGSVSAPDNTAEIRTFRHVAEIHARRFKGARVPLDVNAYRELSRSMHAFFAGQGFAVVLVDVTDAPASNYPPPMPSATQSQMPWIIAGMAVAAAIGIGFIAFVASQKRANEPAPRPAISASAAPASS